MNDFQGGAVMVLLFALRCAAPLLLLAALGYAMKRLVAHWEAHEAADAAARPAIPLPMAARPSADAVAAALKVPCWVLNNCDEAARARCPACRNPSLACWVARTWAEGRLPAKCADCPRYTGTPTPAIGH